jgi:spastin
LLFGPPGNGKTMIAKAVASQCDATFFNISASVLTSKFVGEGEKIVRALFEIAREKQPSIIFIDEIDSILTSRSADDNEASRRLKTEFLIAFDGVGSSDDDKILVMAATNLPDSLDEAVKRRFSRRIYVPMPDAEVRGEIIKKLFKSQKLSLSARESQQLIARTEGYSASDLKELCKDAAMVPLRRIDLSKLSRLSPSDAPPITYEDFIESLQNVKPTVSEESLKMFEEWNDLYGTKLATPSKNDSSEEKCRVQ